MFTQIYKHPEISIYIKMQFASIKLFRLDFIIPNPEIETLK